MIEEFEYNKVHCIKDNTLSNKEITVLKDSDKNKEFILSKLKEIKDLRGGDLNPEISLSIEKFIIKSTKDYYYNIKISYLVYGIENTKEMEDIFN